MALTVRTSGFIRLSYGGGVNVLGDAVLGEAVLGDPQGQEVVLSAYAEGATGYRWTLLDAPIGSVTMSGTHGDFVDGTATGQNPTFQVDTDIEGSYVFQCVASNATDTSNPNTDKQNAQQVVVIGSERFGLRYPSNYQYDWVDEHNYTLQKLEENFPSSITALNATLGSSCDLTTASRPPSGAAGGDLSGTYPSPTVQSADGLSFFGINNPVANSGIRWSNANGRWELAAVYADSFLDLVDNVDTTYEDKNSLIVAANEDENGVILVSLNDLLQNFPVFQRDPDDISLVTGRVPVGRSSTFRLIFNDDRVYTATGPLTVDFDTTGIGGRDPAESASTGFWNIYAVPTASHHTFGLVASKVGPLGSGPTSYPDYKYLWTVRCHSTGGGVEIDPFIQCGQWYHTVNYSDDRYTLMAMADDNPTEAGGWTPFDGASTMPGTSVTLADIRAVVPTAWVKEVQIQMYVDMDASTEQFMEFSLSPGYGNIFGVNYQTYSISYRHGSNWNGREASTAKFILRDEMLSMAWGNVGAGAGMDAGVTLRGYKNTLAGV